MAMNPQLDQTTDRGYRRIGVWSLEEAAAKKARIEAAGGEARLVRHGLGKQYEVWVPRWQEDERGKVEFRERGARSGARNPDITKRKRKGEKLPHYITMIRDPIGLWFKVDGWGDRRFTSIKEAKEAYHSRRREEEEAERTRRENEPNRLSYDEGVGILTVYTDGVPVETRRVKSRHEARQYYNSGDYYDTHTFVIVDSGGEQNLRNPGQPPGEGTPWQRTWDLVAGDVIRFEEKVWGGSYRSPRLLGTRKVTARILKESYGKGTGQHTFTLEVLESSGYDPLKAGERILRKGRNLYGGEPERTPWDNEKARLEAADEKHARGDKVRAAKIAAREGGMRNPPQLSERELAILRRIARAYPGTPKIPVLATRTTDIKQAFDESGRLEDAYGVEYLFFKGPQGENYWQAPAHWYWKAVEEAEKPEPAKGREAAKVACGEKGGKGSRGLRAACGAAWGELVKAANPGARRGAGRRGRDAGPFPYGKVQPAYSPRFMTEEQYTEMANLWHLSRVPASGRKDWGLYERMIWTAEQMSKKYPEISPTAAYKDLEGMLDGGW